MDNYMEARSRNAVKTDKFKGMSREQMVAAIHILEKFRFEPFTEATMTELHKELQDALGREHVGVLSVNSTTQFHRQLVELYKMIDWAKSNEEGGGGKC